MDERGPKLCEGAPFRPRAAPGCSRGSLGLTPCPPTPALLTVLMCGIPELPVYVHLLLFTPDPRDKQGDINRRKDEDSLMPELTLFWKTEIFCME